MEPLVITTQTALHQTVESAVQTALARASPRLRPAERDRPSKAFLTNVEAQAYLGLSKATLARYRAEGTLPYSKVGQSVYYETEAVEDLLRRNAVRPSGGRSKATKGRKRG